jgi:hypothetical protein
MYVTIAVDAFLQVDPGTEEKHCVYRESDLLAVVAGATCKSNHDRVVIML